MIEEKISEITRFNFFSLPPQVPGEPVLVTDPSEAAKLKRLRESTEVSSSRLATCTDPETGIQTTLAVIIVAAETNRPVQLTQTTPSEPFKIDLPDSHSHRLGLFLGSNEKGLRIAARTGNEYTLPLMSHLRFDKRHETILRLSGLMENEEPAEFFWANRIRLFKGLGFIPENTRPVFKCGFCDDVWHDSPLYVNQKPGTFRPDTQAEQPLINALSIRLYQDWENPLRNPYLGKLVGAFDLEMAAQPSAGPTENK